MSVGDIYVSMERAGVPNQEPVQWGLFGDPWALWGPGLMRSNGKTYLRLCLCL